MLFNVDSSVDSTPVENTDSLQGNDAFIKHLETEWKDNDFVVSVLSKPSEFGELKKNCCKHYYSSGAFNLVQLVLYILKQTGPANLFLSTYSIAERFVATLSRKLEEGQLLSCRFLIDNRVKSISPKPYAYLLGAFPSCVRTRSLHAKVALVWNDDWKVDIVGSQNATHNPKLERGCIYTTPDVFDFDFKAMQEEYDRAGIE